MRRLMKFLHTMGAIGLMGAMASLVVMLGVVPPPSSALTGYALMRGAMAAVATWVFLPSLALMLVAGLLAIALTRAFQNAGWAWVKLATGVLMFEYGFVGVQGPMQAEAERAAQAVLGRADPATLAGSLGAERGTLWVLLAIATLNVALGVWRPRILRRPQAAGEGASQRVGTGSAPR
ncbi:hypothetical protein FF100_11255 [Methylobacterium terricola]|uniref:DUF2269 domain-containing protein n=1 Tax=Methylobacterium terricola TaxID=2583531 RepID=A0A5C4LIF4_9HYPH|nr:hypothetical protein [Methylobacterium terricola]TNC13383.1 hypothetical protein FF100_11255 [Methylobacterium terricola]